MAHYLEICREDDSQRDYPLRDVFKGVRFVAKTGCHWRKLPNDPPPWTVVYQQMRRWMTVRCFEIMVEDCRDCWRHPDRRIHAGPLPQFAAKTQVGLWLDYRSTERQVSICSTYEPIWNVPADWRLSDESPT